MVDFHQAIILCLANFNKEILYGTPKHILGCLLFAILHSLKSYKILSRFVSHAMPVKTVNRFHLKIIWRSCKILGHLWQDEQSYLISIKKCSFYLSDIFRINLRKGHRFPKIFIWAYLEQIVVFVCAGEKWFNKWQKAWYGECEFFDQIFSHVRGSIFAVFYSLFVI